MEKSSQYKGLFYNNATAHKYYEGGAHFSYIALFKKLIKLKEELTEKREMELLSFEEKHKEKDPDIKIEKKEEKNDNIEKILIKKSDFSLLSKLKSNSMVHLLNESNIKKKENKDNKDNINFRKVEKNEQKAINNKNIIQKGKKLTYNNSVQTLNKVNFNSSVYSNQSNLNMPIIYNHKNRSETKKISNSNNMNNIETLKIIKKNTYLEPLKGKNYNNIIMSSTIGFNENNKFINFSDNNIFSEVKGKISRNRNHNSSNLMVCESLNKYNSINLMNKLNILKKYNKSLMKSNKNIKINFIKNISYQTNNNKPRKLTNNEIINTKINFFSDLNLDSKKVINNDKRGEKFNLSIINFPVKNYNNSILYRNKSKNQIK